jgi:hypothetical protein
MQPLGRSLPASTRAACPSRDSDSPAPFTVLAVVTIVVWALGFIVPAGEYRLDSGGVPIAGTYEPTAAAQSFGQRVEDLFLAPVNGLSANELSSTQRTYWWPSAAAMEDSLGDAPASD